MPTPSHPTPPKPPTPATPPKPPPTPPRPPQQPQQHQQPHDADKHQGKHDDAADKHRDPNRPDPPPPNQPQQHQPQPTPVAGVAPPEPGLAPGARPKDERDPQAAKFEAHAAPPSWDEPKPPSEPKPAFMPKPALDPRAEAPPVGAYADGMTIADEQRARAAWVEEHGLKEYDDATDQRPDDERPRFDKDALAIGGAFVSAGAQKQVPGVVPPTKRE